ncbi:hypothetical protein FQN50_002738 [Emmonsiellopsis sp. PD_5]|nr:hypothetical protein FQN50_002738 [Emmonsiellopsis sp. PD_5]
MLHPCPDAGSKYRSLVTLGRNSWVEMRINAQPAQLSAKDLTSMMLSIPLHWLLAAACYLRIWHLRSWLATTYIAGKEGQRLAIWLPSPTTNIDTFLLDDPTAAADL